VGLRINRSKISRCRTLRSMDGAIRMSSTYPLVSHGEAVVGRGCVIRGASLPK
jgi:hypothetical protein